MTTINDIRDNFELLDEWDDRYRYVIELGRTLEPMPEAEHSAANKVNGCVSQVWLQKLVDRNGGAPILKYRGDSEPCLFHVTSEVLLGWTAHPKAPDASCRGLGWCRQAPRTSCPLRTDQGLATCHAPLSLPSPSVSPAALSFFHA